MAFIALTSGALAYCPPVPDNADTGYVGNDMNRALCIQRELSEATEARNRRSQLDAALSKMQRDLQQQKFLLQQQQDLFRSPLLP